MSRKVSSNRGASARPLIIAIVVVGILTAVAIVGIASLTNNGEDSACSATADAASAAQAVFYANTNGTYPTEVGDMVGDELELSGGATVSADGEDINGTGWTMTGSTGTGADAITFTCP